jgi:hypothetical protein
MINNQSDKPEKLIPMDSEQKEIQHPKDDKEAVVKTEDKHYKEQNVNFGNVAEKKEKSDVRKN